MNIEEENHISDTEKMVEESQDYDLCYFCSNEMIACVCMAKDEEQ